MGGHVGGGWGKKDLTDFSKFYFGPASPVADTSGWLAGGQIGCNYQFATNWVAGFEVANSLGEYPRRVGPVLQREIGVPPANELDRQRRRAGRLCLGQMIDLRQRRRAWAGDKYHVPGSFAGSPYDLQASETRFGWTIGGGVEWAFWQNWSADLEYAYYDFGNSSVSLSGVPGNIKQNVQTVTVGVNYHF